MPSLYPGVHDNTSTRWGYAVPKEAPSVVYIRCLPDLSVTDPVAQYIVPYTRSVQDRLAPRDSALVLVGADSARLV